MTLTTRSSLLERLRSDGAEAWQEFSRFYRPFLDRVAQRIGLRGQDVDEVVQAVIVDFYQARATFAYDRSKGRFRDYLKKALVTRLLKIRQQTDRAGTPVASVPESWQDEWKMRWEEEYRQHVLREALDRIRGEVEPRTYQAFQLYAVEQLDVREVAQFLGVSTSAVYVYKNRVLARLKTIVQELLEE